jgi:hypothetical protein
MAVITPATWLVSTTAEGGLIEAAQKVAALEASTSTNPDELNNVTLVFNGDTSTVTITATIPVTATVSASGGIVLAADPYLS